MQLRPCCRRIQKPLLVLSALQSVETFPKPSVCSSSLVPTAPLEGAVCHQSLPVTGLELSVVKEMLLVSRDPQGVWDPES